MLMAEMELLNLKHLQQENQAHWLLSIVIILDKKNEGFRITGSLCETAIHVVAAW